VLVVVRESDVLSLVKASDGDPLDTIADAFKGLSATLDDDEDPYALAREFLGALSMAFTGLSLKELAMTEVSNGD
jgi:hypothetical protein